MAKLKATAIPAPESIDLPGFIRDRDAQAARAGLRLERFMGPWQDIDRVITHYHGSKEQIGASGFIADDFRWPCTDHPIRRGVHVFSPSYWRHHSDYAGRVHRNGDGAFRLTLEENCPRNLIRLSAELERYELHDTDFKSRRVVVSRIIHYGSERALLAASIAADEDEVKQAPNGWLIHERDLDEERRAEERRQNERAGYQNPHEFREDLENWIVTATRLARRAVETRHGYRYTLDPAALQGVINAIEAAAQGLRTVPVKVEKLVNEEAQATAREGSTRASNDANFQRFLGQLLHNGQRPQE
jgi:hypothetical protein